eukprot:GFYU01008143.1.p1 GENE.GFYU01008143.1~~GFYU01008143.1.p1  ORF type:complete len:431 (+),score=89.85 GFYU01008143.1:174-1466(+)
MANSLGIKKKVAYFYDGDIGNYYYGSYHPMKPYRLVLTHNLVLHYDMWRKMNIYRPHRATYEELATFHSQDYVDFLHRVSPENITQEHGIHEKFNIGDDCPVQEGLYDYCKLYSGASVDGAKQIISEQADIAINWSGGLHHAKKSEASGFCYVNDIVLAILELLKFYPRVLYVDIDIHHGDGVEEAFFTTDRVMTASFHKYGNFFPGTGDLKDVGALSGKYYSVNVPLRDGITDDSFQDIFQPVMQSIMDHYRPSVVVLQCGADSLAHDRLGCFNLTIKGHAECVRFMKTFGVPLLVLGGGGYTIRNVARCWAYETSVLLNMDLDEDLPYNDFFEYFGPDFKLHIHPRQMSNLNTKSYLEKIRIQVQENLKLLDFAPNVTMHQVPPELMYSSDEEEENDDERSPRLRRDQDTEWYKDDHDNDHDGDIGEV